MKKAFEQLKEFHEIYDCHRSEKPNLPSQDVRDMRQRILEEEYTEYLDAEQDNNIVEIADALADIIYVAIGTAVAYGIPIDKIFEEVHNSNMSKLGQDGKPLRREDGKVLKGPNYFRPNIKRIIDESNI